MTRKDARGYFQESLDLMNLGKEQRQAYELAVEALSQPPADQWIPVTYHEATEEEKEAYGEEQPYILDCPLPEEDGRILVCTKRGYVYEDTACCDGGWYLDSGKDFMDILAWMPLPEPYKGVE